MRCVREGGEVCEGRGGGESTPEEAQGVNE